MTRGVTGWVVALALATWLSGCFNPDDIFPITGTLVSDAGLAGVPVRLFRATSEARLGPCTNDRTAAPFKQTTSDADGGYGFEVFRAQAQSLTGFSVDCFALEARFESGSVAWADLYQFGSPLEVGPLYDWRAHPRWEGEVLRLDPVVPDPDAREADGGLVLQVTHQLDLATTDGGLLWRLVDQGLGTPGLASPPRAPLAVPRAVLEDFSGQTAAQASVLVVAPPSNGPMPSRLSSVALTYTSPAEQLTFAGGAAAVSRGASCPGLPSPCPLTDGDLRVVLLADGPSTVTVQLPSPRRVSAVVLRGLVTSFAGPYEVRLRDADGGALPPITHELGRAGATDQDPVMVDADGGFLGRVPAVYDVVLLDAGVTVSAASLVFPTPLSGLAEVSLVE